MASILLSALGRGGVNARGITHDGQRADVEWPGVEMPDGSAGTARFKFRFARGAWPILGSRVEEVAQAPHGLRVVLANSGLWDMNYDTGVTDASFLHVYMRKIAAFFLYVRDGLSPSLAESDAEEAKGRVASSTPLPPQRWLWRSINPTHWAILDSERKRFLTSGRAAVMNEFVREAIRGASEGGRGTHTSPPQWEWFDSFSTMPLDRIADFVSGVDGYHPNNAANGVFVQRLFNQLCGARIGASTLEGLLP
jgi:hypothetical protein